MQKIKNIEIKTTKSNGEYRLRLFINGEYQAGADYFTDCKEDARETERLMFRFGAFSDKTHPIAISEQIDYDNETGEKSFFGFKCKTIES